MRSRTQIFLLIIVIISAVSCRKGFLGEEVLNIAPETFVVADTIIRAGDDRLESEVHIIWWGNDPDGFVTGYEFTFSAPDDPSAVWQYTENQDSIFILAPPPGSDTLDFTFYVRAIDNDGFTDSTPASITYPVKNSPPDVMFVDGLNQPVRSFPVVKFFWEGTDPDGAVNLAGYELAWNDTLGTLVSLDASASSVMLEATDAGADEMQCRLYVNSSEIADEQELPGMLGNTWNTLYIRSVDQSDARSPWRSSDSIFIKKVSSPVLLVDAYTTASTPTSFYTDNLASIGISGVDTLAIFDDIDGVLTQQSADNLTQEKVFALFDLIIWYSNSAESSLSLAQRTTESFFENGGKLLMSVYVSSAFDPLSNFLDFTPIASLVSPEDTTLILDLGATLTPVDGAYPELEGTAIVGVVKPVNLQIGAEPVYNAALTAKDNTTLTFSPWEGNSTVIARKLSDGVPVFIMSTLELHKLNGAMNTDAFFEEVIVNEFGF